MSNTLSKTINTKSRARGLVESLARTTISCFGKVHRHLLRARTRKVLRSLSEEQLRDAGIDRSLVHSSLEVDVDARLMSTLMTLR